MQKETPADFIESVRPLFRRRAIYRILLALAVGGVVIGHNSLFIIPTFIFAMVIIPLLVQQEIALETRVWQRFARQLDTTEVSTGQPLGPLRGVLGSMGDKRQLFLLAAGSYRGYPIRLLEQTIAYNPASENRSFSRHYRILEITTNQDYYHVFVDSKSNNSRWASCIFSTAMNMLSLSVDKNRQLTVEGDVNNFFKIYVPTNARYESLVTLSPEKLLALRDYGTAFDVEFAGNKIYVITSHKIRNIRDVLVYQEAVFKLLEHIGVDITRKRGDVKASLSVRTPSVLTF